MKCSLHVQCSLFLCKCSASENVLQGWDSKWGKISYDLFINIILHCPHGFGRRRKFLTNNFFTIRPGACIIKVNMIDFDFKLFYVVIQGNVRQ